MTPYLTVFIPAYNEEQNLVNCVEMLFSKLDELDISNEIIIIDDGSSDQTTPLADSIAQEHSRASVIHHEVNRGIGAAFMTALKNARSEWLILIPADLALDPDELHRYFEAAPNADIVVGLRSDRSDYTLLRHIVSRSNIFLIQKLFGMKLRQFQYISMYRLDALRAIKVKYWRSAFFLAEILIKARDMGYRLVEVEILYAPRLTGKPTGAKLLLVIRTVIDIFHFWVNWIFNRQRNQIA